MATLDPDMAELVLVALRRFGVDVRLQEGAKGFEDGQVQTEAGIVPADIVVLGIGVPAQLCTHRDAGLTLGVRDSIHVDRGQQTSAPGVWSATVAKASISSPDSPSTSRSAPWRTSSRVTPGINIGGGSRHVGGVVGTAITKICNVEVARARGCRKGRRPGRASCLRAP